jgi:hypothetical protein
VRIQPPQIITMKRKIKVPPYCEPMTRTELFGRKDCEHDFPPESEQGSTKYVSWRCSKCKMIVTYERITT